MTLAAYAGEGKILSKADQSQETHENHLHRRDESEPLWN